MKINFRFGLMASCFGRMALLMGALFFTGFPAGDGLMARESRWDFGSDWRFIQKDVTLRETENAWNAERTMWGGGTVLGGEAALGGGTVRSNGWRTVDLPHDWSIEGEFSKDNPTGQGGWLPAGVGWYVKEFEYGPINPRDRRVFLQFDGVMSHSTVYVNGHEVGTRANGYASFCYDVSDFVNRDGLNRVAVRVDNSVQPASRWYTGCGINRRVRLLYKNDVHIPYQGVFAHYDDSLGQVCFEVQVCNKSSKVQKLRLELEVPDDRRISGKRVRLEPGEELHYEFRFKADGLAWWSPENPARQLRCSRSAVRSREGLADQGQVQVTFLSSFLSGPPVSTPVVFFLPSRRCPHPTRAGARGKKCGNSQKVACKGGGVWLNSGRHTCTT